MKKKYNRWIFMMGFFLFGFGLAKTIVSLIFPQVALTFQLSTMVTGITFIYLSHAMYNN